ncbi:MAG: DUF445 family protein [Deltaproteobacteria bacterium]|nr:DUF445 family protein [Deltaproteobacteria bacterium]MBW2658851.1 DUF445 family protein [Deltaproteobacteria bacterium]
MSYLPPEIAPYIKYAAPPVIGAVIGYVTNRVAIRMLFRPLKTWRVGGVRVPMTPGVIPAKREDLAENMGEVVGDHLLTGREISDGLQQDNFQKQLLLLIEEKIISLMEEDLDNLPSLIPDKYNVYFDIARKTVTYQIKGNIHTFINSEEFSSIVGAMVDNRIEDFLNHDLSSIISDGNRDALYQFVEKNMAKMFASIEMEQWVNDFVHQKVYAALQQEKSIADFLPESLHELLLATIEKQTGPLLLKLSTLVSDEDVREKVVKGVCSGVDGFIESLGSMADMVRGFLNMETVEKRVHEYLEEKNDDIVAWLQSEKVHSRVKTSIREKSLDFIHKPVSSYVSADDDQVVEDFCAQFTRQLLLLIRGREVATTLSVMIRSNVENYIDSGDIKIKSVVSELMGQESILAGKLWFKGEILSLIKSDRTLSSIDSMIDSLVGDLLNRRIGRLARIIPVGVRNGVSRAVTNLASTMLKTGIPNLVKTLNIKKIVTKKVNSLDLLKLEGLLLTIMEEQFKYINLFGALLGFLIGCLNLLFLYRL